MTYVLQPERKCFHFTSPRLLATVWFTGFAVGIFICDDAVPFLLSVMRGMSFESVSIVGLLVSSGIPFLISAVAVIYSRPGLFLTVCFLKAIGFLLFSASLIFQFGAGGWLIQGLLMSHEILSLPIWYIFTLRCLRYGKLPDAFECFGLCSLEILSLTFSCCTADPMISSLGIL